MPCHVASLPSCSIVHDLLSPTSPTQHKIRHLQARRPVRWLTWSTHRQLLADSDAQAVARVRAVHATCRTAAGLALRWWRQWRCWGWRGRAEGATSCCLCNAGSHGADWDAMACPSGFHVLAGSRAAPCSRRAGQPPPRYGAACSYPGWAAVGPGLVSFQGWSAYVGAWAHVGFPATRGLLRAAAVTPAPPLLLWVRVNLSWPPSCSLLPFPHLARRYAG